MVDAADDGSYSIGVNLRIDWDRDGCAEYFVGLEEWGSYVQRDGDESICPTTTLIDVPGVLLAADDWHTVRIEVSGDTLTLYIDGELGLTVVDSEPIFNGYFGLEADRGTTAYFDDVRVIELAPADGEQTVTATVTQNANLRSGPSTDFAAVSSANVDDQLTVIGQNANGSWLLVRTASRQVAWIAAYLVEMQGELAAVPVRSG